MVMLVVGHDPRKSQCVDGIGEALGEHRGWGPVKCCRFPQTPGFGGPLADGEIGTVESLIVGSKDIARAFGFWQGITETIPLLGKEDRRPTAEEPVNFLVSSGRHPE